MAQPVSDDDRRRLEEAIAAALLLIYQGRSRHALAQLGTTLSEIPVSDAARAKIEAFASERAQLVQDGINQRLAGAQSSDGTAQGTQEIDQYNQDRLVPFLGAWAANQGFVDTLRETPGSESDTTAAEQELCNWIQNTDFIDDCTAAAAASPAPLQTLIDIAGGEPQTVHQGCLCEIELA